MKVTYIGFEGSPSSEEHRRPGQLSHEELSVQALGDVTGVDLSGQLVSHGEANIFLVVEGLGIESVRIVVFAIGLLGVQMV